jgi:hypothetical protein
MGISAWIDIVLTAMKRGDEAFNASLLQFLSIVKRFIATIFFSALKASSLLIFMEKHRLTLHRRYFLKEICCLTLIAITFKSNFAHLWCLVFPYAHLKCGVSLLYAHAKYDGSCSGDPAPGQTLEFHTLNFNHLKYRERILIKYAV